MEMEAPSDWLLPRVQKKKLTSSRFNVKPDCPNNACACAIIKNFAKKTIAYDAPTVLAPSVNARAKDHVY